MKVTEAHKLMKDESALIDKLQAIVQQSITEEKLIIENCLLYTSRCV